MNKVAVITGAVRGIGRSIARRLAMDGFIVAVSYSSETAEAMALVSEIHRLGGDAIALQADVANQIDVELLFRYVRQTLGSIDVVVCNASVIPPWSSDKLTIERADIAIATSLRATLLVLAQAAREIANDGSILVALSGVLGTPAQENGPSGTFVERVEARAYALANQLRWRNVTVNLIARGPLEPNSSMHGKGDASRAYDDGALRPDHPGQSPDLADVVSLLAGPEGHLVNSQLFVCRVQPRIERGWVAPLSPTGAGWPNTQRRSAMTRRFRNANEDVLSKPQEAHRDGRTARCLPEHPNRYA